MADRTEAVDVVVVGCGPGGAVLAYPLARRGRRRRRCERAGTFESLVVATDRDDIGWEASDRRPGRRQ